MYNNDFEAAFGNFLENEVYDRGEDALFTLVRAAFMAGWKAARGELSESHGSFRTLSDQESSVQ